MSLRNENIGLVVAFSITAVGMLLTGGNPNGVETLLIVVLGLGAGLWLSTYLNLRDGTYSRSARRK